MFFRNLLVYRITQAIPFDYEALQAALDTKRARVPASQELSTYGFIAPFGKGEDAPLVHVSGDYLLIAARKEERILPGSVIRRLVTEKVTEIEDEQQRKVYKKERDQIKDEIIQAALPKAFTRTAATFAAILPKQGLILVDCSAPRRAEDLLSTLREVIGSLPVRPVSTKIAPAVMLTDWVKKEDAASGFYVLDQALMKDTCEGGGQLTAKAQDLTAEEIQLALQAGKQVTKLSLAWQDKLHFILDEKLIITRLKFEDVLTEKAEQDGGEDALGVLDAQFFLNCATLAEFIPELLTALGGEEIPQSLSRETDYEQRVLANPVRREARPEYQVDIEEGIDATYGENDELYEEAKAFVIESRRASISAVQRKLKIGYNRAARMIETMENQGIVTPMNTNGGREVIAGAAA